MKLRIVAILALSAMALSAEPQTAKAAGQTPPPVAIQPDGMQGPNLSPAQQAKAVARKKKMADDVNALKIDTKLTPQQKEAKFVKLQDQFKTDMLAILTPAQRAEFLRRQSAADSRMKQIMDLQTELSKSLTADQQKKIASIRQADAKTFETIQADAKMSQSDKMTKVIALSKLEREKVTGVLTPAQRAEFDKLQRLYPAPPTR